MTAPDPAGAATEVVQKAAAPVAFIAIVIGGALAVAALVKRYGRSLPLPAYLVDFVDGDDEDQDDEPDQDTSDELEHQREQWG